MIFISVIKQGTLRNQLHDSDWKKVKSVSIKGVLDDSDIHFIKELTVSNKGLYYIDLLKVENIDELDFPALFERGVSNLSITDGLERITKKTIRSLSASTFNIPQSVCSIEKNAFSACTELKIINVHEHNAFYKSINGVLYTKDGYELLFCPPKREGTITIQECTGKIAPKAFQGCDKLKLVILPQSIEREDTGTLIKDFTNKKTEIRWNADQDHFDLGETHYSSGGKVLERHTPDSEDYKEGDPHFDLYKKAEYDFVVPNNVEAIRAYAFENCFQLKDIKLPNALASIGDSAFANCTHLNAIELPNKLKQIGEGCFNGCRNLGKICSWAIKPPKCRSQIINYTQDKMLYVPKGSLESYKKAKGWNMFRNIREVESLTTVTYRMCSGEKNTITYSSSITKSELKDYLQSYWQNIGKITIEGKISDSDLSFLKEMSTKGKLTDIDLSECLISKLPKKAFADAASLVSFNTPSNVTEIPDGCFLNCKRLRRLRLGESTERIGTFAFADCWNIKAIEFSERTNCIDRGAFWNCRNLENIFLYGTNLTIAEDAFRGCDSIKKIENHSSTPPTCETDSFPASLFSSTEITFPSNGIMRYVNAPIWSSFQKKNAEDSLF